MKTMNLTVILNCATKADQSPKPGIKTTILKFNALDDPASPNRKLFGAGQYAAEFMIANVTPETASFFESGSEYDFVITKHTAPSS